MRHPGNSRLRAMSLLLLVVLCLGAVAPEAAVGVSPLAPRGEPPPGAAFLGPFHMVLLHFPIGLFSFAALLEAVAWFRPFEGLRRVQGSTLGLGVLSAIVTSILGLYRSAGGDYSAEILSQHRNTGIALTVVAALTLVLHSALLRGGVGWLRWYRGALGATLMLLLVASHHGGSLTHGEGFLTHNAPQPIRGWIDRWNSTPPQTRVSPSMSALGAGVAKVFETRCLSCHGPEKQKGRFRIDQRESLLKGGASGVAAVVPGDPARSGLFRMILLPAAHEEVMPPAGKEPLSDSEILAVFRWIQAGAP